MLEPITKKMTDQSNDNQFRFTFYCDICESPWHSIPYSSGTRRGNGEVDTLIRENERAAAYERANHEAMVHFNRCPKCKRIVCDECFRIFPEEDMCKDCAASQKMLEEE